jgi:hypothetical protein
MLAFPVKIGWAGRARTTSARRCETLKRVLPPDLFARFQDDAFQEDPAKLQAAVRLMQQRTARHLCASLKRSP